MMNGDRLDDMLIDARSIELAKRHPKRIIDRAHLHRAPGGNHGRCAVCVCRRRRPRKPDVAREELYGAAFTATGVRGHEGLGGVWTELWKVGHALREWGTAG